MTDLPASTPDEFNDSASYISSQPFSASPAPSPSIQQPMKNKKKILPIILIITIILILIGGFFVYQAYAQAPERIVRKMFANLANVKSWRYAGKLDTEVFLNSDYDLESLLTTSTDAKQDKEYSNKKNFKVKIDYNGLMNIQDLNNPQISSIFNIETDILASSSFSLGFETRFLNKFFYINITQIPDLGFWDTSSLKDQWIKIDVRKQPETIKIDQVNDNFIDSQLSVDKITKIATAIQQANILTITDRLPNEKIDGVDSYQYKFILNQDGLKTLQAELTTIFNNNTESDFKIKFADNDKKEIELLNGVIWIGKKDLLPRQISFDLVTTTANKTQFVNKTSQIISFSNFNQALIVDEPVAAKDLKEVFSSFLSTPTDFSTSTMATTTLNGDFTQSSDLDSDNDGLSNYEELYLYGTDPLNPDTDDDGYLDGDEVRNGYNPNGPGKLLLVDKIIVDKPTSSLLQ